MNTSNVATWFEIPAVDLARAVRFYETVFAIRLIQEPCPSGMTMAVFPADGEAVRGCLIQHEAYKPGADGTVVYLNGGDDLSAPLARAEEAGARIVVPKTLITPEIGYFAQFIDSEGNRVGLYSMR
ncbi:VOC family protein [Azospirillum picis]|uniref:Enzyme related to lactoylglutathione lyase n=1 Tax=Azospirillum picis TaxID=488438 RepID=A0ABU0MPP5_9PROT|nr:VOC family protein [Azospirillum picis]MBP2301727.1 putative enzyme related to lactoylglutathione lyase [Azospirillum picis]MDQ0535449.1 putative enzyme related to lactoylglutathione lyase [Azospirillum picis]